MSEQLSVEELKRILLEQRPTGELPGRITAESGISREIYEQARAAGLIDENGFDTF
jgi:hypothetical protein